MIDTNEMRQRMTECDVSEEDILALCDEIDRLRAKPKPQGKTVYVRVAVAVDKKGRWSANGWQGASEEQARDAASEMVEEGESIYWLTADLPIPKETTVEAEVENGR